MVNRDDPIIVGDDLDGLSKEDDGLEKKSILAKYSCTIKNKNLVWVRMKHSKHIFMF